MISLPDGLHGAHIRSELTPLIGEYAVRCAINNGRLKLFTRDVLVDSHRVTELMTRAAAAQLMGRPDGTLSGFTALALLGCSAAPTAPVHVIVPNHRTLRRRQGLVVHHGSLEDQDVCDVAGLRVMVHDLAVTEVLCRGRRWDAFACLDQVLSMATETERPELRATIEARVLARADSRGRRRARALLELATGLAESPPESWVMLVIADAGLPWPTAQYRVLDLAGKEVYRLDLAWPELRIAVEYDGYEAHEGTQRYDAAREADLRRRGWIVIRATNSDLSDPSRLIAEITSALRVRGAAA